MRLRTSLPTRLAIAVTSVPHWPRARCSVPVFVCAGEAEGVGFEPTKNIAALTGFQDQRHRPLGEPSSAPVAEPGGPLPPPSLP